jgi:nicotinamide-nucleotide amidase
VALVKHFEGDRDQVRRQAVLFALQGVSDFVGEL